MTVIINGSTGITNVNGTAAAPAETGTDTDSGIVYGTNTVSLATNGTTAMTVDASQNVGIGTASPGQKLEVAGNVLLSNNQYFGVKDTTGAAVGFPIYTGSNDAIFGYLASGSTGISTYQFRSGNNVERMRIDSSGNLLVGGTTARQFITATQNAATGTGIEINNTNAGANTTKTAGLYFSGTDTISAYKTTGNITVGPAQQDYIGSYMAFSNRVSDASAERMRIDPNGYLLINYTTSNGSYKLQVNSQIFATSSTIATSDGRYKKDIQPLDGALGLVSQLNPVQFSWKKHPIHDFDTSTPTIGFIAQEVAQVLVNKPYLNSVIKANQCVIEPEETDVDGNITKEAVTEEFFGIAEGNMIALLTKAIQEQQALITTLTARIEALENK